MKLLWLFLFVLPTDVQALSANRLIWFQCQISADMVRTFATNELDDYFEYDKDTKKLEELRDIQFSTGGSITVSKSGSGFIVVIDLPDREYYKTVVDRYRGSVFFSTNINGKIAKFNGSCSKISPLPLGNATRKF